MNIAFYVDVLNDCEQNTQIVECLNTAIQNNEVSDASLFYNNVAPNRYKTKFGFFNSTELWNFTGLLISTTTNNTLFADKVVNRFKLAFLYRPEGLIGLLEVANKYDVLVLNQDDYDEVYRKTGKYPKLLSELSVKEITGVLQ